MKELLQVLRDIYKALGYLFLWEVTPKHIHLITYDK